MDLRERCELINRLESALHYGTSHMNRLPDTLKEVLENEAWEKFEANNGKIFQHNDFKEFVETKIAYAGLASTMDVIREVVMKNPELSGLLYQALGIIPGTLRSFEIELDLALIPGLTRVKASPIHSTELLYPDIHSGCIVYVKMSQSPQFFGTAKAAMFYIESYTKDDNKLSRDMAKDNDFEFVPVADKWEVVC
jgi:hypothetical protein